MSQFSNGDTTFDSSLMINGDISVLPESMEENVNVKDTSSSNNDSALNTREGTPNPDVSAAQVFSRSSGSNKKLRLPKKFTNINSLNKAIFNDHKFLRDPKIKSNEEMKEVIVEVCKIWKIINNPNINDRIMSLDISFILDKLVDEYYKNINAEKATPLTVVKTRGKNLTQFEYNLLYYNELTLENLLINNFTTRKNRTVKYTALRDNYKRYFDVKNKRIVVYHTKNHKEVIAPFVLLETILHIHLLNNHIKAETLYRQLLKKYNNITRQVVKDALEMCNLCKTRRLGHEETNTTCVESQNIFKQQVKPWERIQLEVYDLKNDSAKIITLKDSSTHFEWVQEIDKSISDYTEMIAGALAKWLIATANVIPLTFFSITIDWDFLHAILNQVGTELNIKLGAVYILTSSYANIKSKNETKYAKLTITEVYNQTFKRNNEYLSTPGGIPRKLLFTSGIDFSEFEKSRTIKQDKYSSWENIFIEQ